MTEEIETNPPVGKKSYVQDAMVQTIPAIPSENPDNIFSDTDKSSMSSNNKLEHADSHLVPYSHFRWHADAIAEGQEIYQGIVKDVSMKGVNFLVEHNFQNSKLIKLQIHIPPLVVTAPQHVIEVSGKITSTVYDSAEESFRSAISFIAFTLPSDRTFLQSRISAQ